MIHAEVLNIYGLNNALVCMGICTDSPLKNSDTCNYLEEGDYYKSELQNKLKICIGGTKNEKVLNPVVDESEKELQ